MRPSDQPLSQTGGHGDKRRVSEKAGPEIFCPTAGMRSIVCDGADEVRHAVREQLRMGADQIKVMASGGAMSPADELSAVQYTIGELKAAVEEAAAARTYVLAHAYNDDAVRNCLRAGVRSVEHGNLISEETARLIAEAGAYLVSTLVTYEALSGEGLRYGVPEENIRKIDEARERHPGAALRLRGGGQDLLRLRPAGPPLQDRKARELEIKTEPIPSKAVHRLRLPLFVGHKAILADTKDGDMGEVGHECGAYRVEEDVLSQPLKHFDYGLGVGGRTRAERYAEGEIEIHAHFVARIGRNGAVTQKLCAVARAGTERCWRRAWRPWARRSRRNPTPPTR